MARSKIVKKCLYKQKHNAIIYTLSLLLENPGAEVQREVTQVKKYEGAFILLSNLEEDVRNAEIEKVKNIITERQGTVEKVNEWGQRRLAYEIDKKREGYYVFIDFTAGADAVDEIDRICKISDNFVRHMIIVDESK